MASFKQITAQIRGKSGFDRMEKREKIFLLVGIIFVCGFIFLQGVVAPYLGARERLEQSLERKKQEVLDMAILQQEYQELKTRQGGIAKKIEARNPSFSLFSYLEKQATGVKVKDRVTYMKPSTNELDEGFRESAVEMKLEEVTLNQLVDFLVKVESVEDVVIIKRIAIQQNKQAKDLLDVVINIVTFEKKVS